MENNHFSCFILFMPQIIIRNWLKLYLSLIVNYHRCANVSLLDSNMK